MVYNAFRERYHKLAGSALGMDTSDDVTEFKQRMSLEEVNCARWPLFAVLLCHSRHADDFYFANISRHAVLLLLVAYCKAWCSMMQVSPACCQA